LALGASRLDPSNDRHLLSETSRTPTPDPPHKIGGRYLSAWLAHEDAHDPEPPRRPLDVEVALPSEWHEEPMALDPYSAPRID
jgi:hypothetical protein